MQLKYNYYMEWWQAALAFVAIIIVAESVLKLASGLNPRKAFLSQTEFNALPMPKQVAYVWANGKLVGSRPDQNQILIRYQLPAFSAEITYNPETDQIISIRTFTLTNNSAVSAKNNYSFSLSSFV